MGRTKTYIIRLSEEERATLRKTIRNKKTCKTVLKRCQILLELDEEQGTGLTHTQLAHSYAVCPATITNIVQSYVATTSVLIPVRHCEKWTGEPKRTSFRWPVVRHRKGTPAGHSSCWKRKHA